MNSSHVSIFVSASVTASVSQGVRDIILIFSYFSISFPRINLPYSRILLAIVRSKDAFNTAYDFVSTLKSLKSNTSEKLQWVRD